MAKARASKKHTGVDIGKVTKKANNAMRAFFRSNPNVAPGNSLLNSITMRGKKKKRKAK